MGIDEICQHLPQITDSSHMTTFGIKDEILVLKPYSQKASCCCNQLCYVSFICHPKMHFLNLNVARTISGISDKDGRIIHIKRLLQRSNKISEKGAGSKYDCLLQTTIIYQSRKSGDHRLLCSLFDILQSAPYSPNLYNTRQFLFKYKYKFFLQCPDSCGTRKASLLRIPLLPLSMRRFCFLWLLKFRQLR